MKPFIRNLIPLLFIGLVSNVYSQNDVTWYKIQQIGKGIWRIDDHGTDNIYVVEGEEKALIVDTGMGSADLVKTIRKVTGKPVIVVNTHAHPDHSGGNYQFEKIYLHEADREAAIQYASSEQRERIGATMMGGQAPAEHEKFKGEIFDPEIISVSEGYTFQLGNRVIEVMETPGHTPGSICLLDKSTKTLFSGDNNNSLVWLFLDGCLPLSKYLKTLEKQASRFEEFSIVCPGHGVPVANVFISDQINCVKSILDGTCKSEPYQSFAGNARLCRAGSAAVAFNPDNLD